MRRTWSADNSPVMGSFGRVSTSAKVAPTASGPTVGDTERGSPTARMSDASGRAAGPAVIGGWDEASRRQWIAPSTEERTRLSIEVQRAVETEASIAAASCIGRR